jgi:hypothetical protein
MTESTTETVLGIPILGQSEGAAKDNQYPGKEVEKPIPFSDFVVEAPPSVIRVDHLTAGLAASFTTNIDNPVFKLPTKQDERSGALPAGFAMYAPYYLGTNMTPEEIATDIAKQAAAYLKYLDARHGYDGYVGRMMSVLRRGRIAHGGLQGIEDENILFDVHDWMSIITNRLRHIAPVMVVGNKPTSEAEEYREDTHEKVDPYVNTVVYEPARDGFSERFVLPEFIRSDPNEVVALGWDFFKSWELKRGAEFAALAAEKVGDPLVRASLIEHYRPEYIRRRDYNEEAR